MKKGKSVALTLKMQLEQMPELIQAIKDLRRPLPKPGFLWKVGPFSHKQGDHMPLEISMTSEQQVVLSATPVTATGRPAALDGPVVYSVTAGDCTLVPIDATSVMVVSGDAPGDSSILASGDADLGSGVEAIMDTLTVHVVHANASSLGLSVGIPTPKP